MPGPLHRAIIRKVLQSWSGLVELFQRTAYSQHYVSVGVQHILLPALPRYSSLRGPWLLSLLRPSSVPPIDRMVRISSSELLPALAVVFPMEASRLGTLTGLVRSFWHHISTAYEAPLAEYYCATRKRNELKSPFSWKYVVSALWQAVCGVLFALLFGALYYTTFRRLALFPW